MTKSFKFMASGKALFWLDFEEELEVEGENYDDAYNGVHDALLEKLDPSDHIIQGPDIEYLTISGEEKDD